MITEYCKSCINFKFCKVKIHCIIQCDEYFKEPPALENKKNLNKSIVQLRDNLSIIPSSINLADFEANFTTEYGKELLFYRFKEKMTICQKNG